MNQFWQDRPTLVTGGTGLVGSWLVRRLVENGADVVCLVRDWVPQSELIASHQMEKVKTVRGDVREQPLLERRVRNRYGHPPGRPDDRDNCQPQPGFYF